MAQMPDEGKEQSTREQFLELRKRVIRADNALRCCGRAGAQVALDAVRIANEVLTALLQGGEHPDEALVLAPMGLADVLKEVETTQTVQWVRDLPGAIGIGAVLFTSGAELAAIANQTGALDAASAVARAIGTLTSTRKTGCYECIKAACLSQKHPRLSMTTKIRKRL